MGVLKMLRLCLLVLGSLLVEGVDIEKERLKEIQDSFLVVTIVETTTIATLPTTIITTPLTTTLPTTIIPIPQIITLQTIMEVTTTRIDVAVLLFLSLTIMVTSMETAEGLKPKRWTFLRIQIFQP